MSRQRRPLIPRWFRSSLLTVFVLGAAAGLAGCGDDDGAGSAAPADGVTPDGEGAAPDGARDETDGPSTTMSPEEAMSPEDQMLAFYQCLRDNGVDVADPTPGGAPVAGGPGGLDPNDPTVAAAIDQCRDEVGTVTFGDGQMGENMADTSALIEFVDCIRDHGIEMADPGPDGRLSFPENLDPQDPVFQAASQECSPLLGGGGVLIGDGSGGGTVGQRG